MCRLPLSTNKRGAGKYFASVKNEVPHGEFDVLANRQSVLKIDVPKGIGSSILLLSSINGLLVYGLTRLPVTEVKRVQVSHRPPNLSPSR